MNIAVDAFPLAERKPSGIPNYLRKLLDNMVQMDPVGKYFLYSKEPFEFGPSRNVFKRSLEKTGNKSYENTIWLFSKGVYLMKKDKIDLFFGTRQMLPPVLPGIKKVLVSYDLVWHFFPETMSSYNLMISKILFRKAISSADRIITISKASADSLCDVLGTEKEKLCVIYPAADSYTPLEKSESAEYISKKYGLNRDYVLTVSTLEPRKNLPLLLRIFSNLHGHGLQLAISGATGWKSSPTLALYKELGLMEKEVKFLGYVPEEDMNRLYSGASLFLFPSVYEGFGMPVLEAMASGTAVICSNSSSIPEVAGKAGLLLDPRNQKDWEEAVLALLKDPAKREKMSQEGIERAKLFSWRKSAEKTLEVFNSFF